MNVSHTDFWFASNDFRKLGIVFAISYIPPTPLLCTRNFSHSCFLDDTYYFILYYFITGTILPVSEVCLDKHWKFLSQLKEMLFYLYRQKIISAYTYVHIITNVKRIHSSLPRCSKPDQLLTCLGTTCELKKAGPIYMRGDLVLLALNSLHIEQLSSAS